MKMETISNIHSSEISITGNNQTTQVDINNEIILLGSVNMLGAVIYQDYEQSKKDNKKQFSKEFFLGNKEPFFKISLTPKRVSNIKGFFPADENNDHPFKQTTENQGQTTVNKIYCEVGLTHENINPLHFFIVFIKPNDNKDKVNISILDPKFKALEFIKYLADLAILNEIHLIQVQFDQNNCCNSFHIAKLREKSRIFDDILFRYSLRPKTFSSGLDSNQLLFEVDYNENYPQTIITPQILFTTKFVTILLHKSKSLELRNRRIVDIVQNYLETIINYSEIQQLGEEEIIKKQFQNSFSEQNVINFLCQVDLLISKNRRKNQIYSQKQFKFFNGKVQHFNFIVNEEIENDSKLSTFTFQKELLQKQPQIIPSNEKIQTLILDKNQSISLQSQALNSINNSTDECINREILLKIILSIQQKNINIDQNDYSQQIIQNRQIIKIIPAGNNLKVKIIFSRNVKAFLIKQNQEILLKQENIPADLKKIRSPEQFKAFFKDVYVKLYIYEKGDVKLYIHQCLKGGGKGKQFCQQGLEEYNKQNYEKALELFSIAILEEKDEISYQNYKSITLNELGNIYYQNDEYVKAIVYYNRAYQITNNSDYQQLYLNNKENSLKKLQKLDNRSFNQSTNYLIEKKIYEEALNKYEDVQYLSNKGKALNKLNLDEEVFFDSNKGLLVDCNSISAKENKAYALFHEGDALYQLKKFKQAIIYYDKALALKEEIFYLCKKSAALFQQELYYDAIESANKALNINSEYIFAKEQKAEALNAIALEFDKKCKYEDAVRYFSDAISVFQKAIYYQYLAGAYFNLKQYHKAIDSSNAALEYDQNNLQAKEIKSISINEIGNILFKEQKYKESIKYYDEAIFIDPDQAKFYFNRGNALFYFQEYQESLHSYEKAIELNSNKEIYFLNFVCAYPYAVQRQKMVLLPRDFSLLKKALQSQDQRILNYACQALSYAAENHQKLPDQIIYDLVKINNQQDGEVCELSSNAVKNILLNNSDTKIDQSIIDLFMEGLNHYNIKVRENIIFSFGSIARNGLSLPSYVIQIIEENILQNQNIESSIYALYQILSSKTNIELKCKTANSLLNIGINSNLKQGIQKQSLECLIKIQINGKIFSFDEISCLHLVIENQCPAIKSIGIEITELYLKNSRENGLLHNRLIDSLVNVLVTNTLLVLKILKFVSAKQQFPERSLQFLCNILLSVDNNLTRSQTLEILEDQNNNFCLKEEITYFIRIEEETKKLSSGIQSQIKIKSLNFLQDQAKAGKQITRNCLETLEQLLLHAEKELKLESSILISHIVSNGQELSQSLSDIITNEIVQNNKLSIDNKYHSYLVSSLFKIISETQYVPQNSLEAFETCLINNQNEDVCQNATHGLLVLTQRGNSLSKEGIEDCLKTIKSINFKKEIVMDLLFALKNSSKIQIFSKKAIDYIFELFSSHHNIKDNLIDILEQNLNKSSSDEPLINFDFEKQVILEKLIRENQLNCSLLKIIEAIPQKTTLFSDYIVFENSIQTLKTGNQEEKVTCIVQLQALLKKYVFLPVKVIEILQQNIETIGVVDCLELIISKDSSYINNLNLEILSKQFNLDNYVACSKILLKCIEYKKIFSEEVVNNLSKLLINQPFQIKDSIIMILSILSKTQSLTIKALNLIALEDHITGDNLPVLKIVCERLGNLEELSENHIQKLKLILSTVDEELFYEGSQVALGVLKSCQALPFELINMVIEKMGNFQFVSDWLIELSQLILPQNLEHIYYNKIIACLKDKDFYIKCEALKSLKYIAEFYSLPDSIQIQILHCIQPLTGEHESDQITKEAIGSLGIYYSKSEIISELKIQFNQILNQIAFSFLPENFLNTLSEQKENSYFFILSSIINSDLADYIISNSTPIIEIIRKILLSQLLMNNRADELSLRKFQENLSLFENNNQNLYNIDHNQILRLLILQKDKYNLDQEQINDCLLFLSVDHKKIRKQKFLCQNIFSELQSNWFRQLLQMHNNNLPQKKINQVLKYFELNNFQTELINQLCSKLQIPSDDCDHILDKILLFLEFIKENNISQSQLLEAVQSSISLNKNVLLEWEKILSLQLLMDASQNHGEISCQLLDAGWDLQSILKLLMLINSYNAENDLVNQVLDIISGYKIQKNSHNSNNMTIYEIIKNYQPNQWIQKIHKLAVETNFSSVSFEKDLQTLLKEIRENNLEINITWLENMFNEINNHYQRIQNWKENDIQQWMKNQGRANAHEAIMIAILSQANLITSGNRPRATQILALLILLDAQQEKGRIAQIATGEGKSTIVAMLAAIKALQGEKVDIITSSQVLAIRDVQDKKSFFQLLNLTVADNSGNNAPDCYKSDIVYGDITDFQGDLLNHEFNRCNTKGGRGFGTVIVDEVDSMCIDNIGNSTKIGSHFVGFEYLDILLIIIWQQLDMLDKQIQLFQGNLVFLPQELKIENDEIFSISKDVEVDDDEIEIIDDRLAFTKHMLRSNIEKMVNLSNDQLLENQLRIPKHLIEFAQIELESWIDSAYRAKHYCKKGEDYVIAKKDGINIIAPVDYQNTGVVQVGTAWTNGLHQFLQIKHGLQITAETLSTSFISNIGYFYRYINKNSKGDIITNKIYGLTGTLGSRDAQELLKDTYSIDIIFVPTYKRKQFIELPAKIVPCKWKISVIKSIQEETSKGRAVLVICQTIEETENIKNELVLQFYPRNKIRVYGRNDKDESNAIQNALDVGDVIIATNLAGRGTDIKTTETLEKNGGLHVCVTFLPTNLRVEQQNFGRTSRQGKSGTAQLILKNYGNIESIKRERDESESKRLVKIQSGSIQRIRIKDELFKTFSKLLNKLKSIENNFQKLQCIEEQWGVWLRNLDLDNEEKGFDSNDIMNKFQEFELKLSKDYLSDSVIHNPFQFIQKANKLLEDKDFLNSIEFYDKAICIDPIFSFAAHYNKSYALIKLKGNDYLKKALIELQKAAMNIENHIQPQIEAIQVTYAQIYQVNTNQNPNDSELYKQVVERCDILNNFRGYINQAITIINDSLLPDKKDHEIKVSQTRNLKYFVDQNIASKQTIHLIKEAGLFQFYELNQKPPTPWLSIIAVTGIGLAQTIAGGIILGFSGGAAAGLGTALLCEGISDIIFAVTSAISGNFSWVQYSTQKVISMAVSITCMGWSALKAGVKAAKEGFANGTKAIKSIVVNGLKGIGKQCAQKQVENQITKSIMEEGLNKVANTVCTKLIEKGTQNLAVFSLNKYIELIIDQMKDEIRKSFIESFLLKLNQKQTELIIDNLIAIDSYLGNNHWQNQIKIQSIKLIYPERNKWLSFFESAFKQVLPALISKIHSGVGDFFQKIVKIIEAIQFSQKILFFEESFFGKFHELLENIQTKQQNDPFTNGLNSLEHLIQNIDKLNISEKDSYNIVCLLQEQGVIDNLGQFDSQVLFGDTFQGSQISDRKILITSLRQIEVQNRIKFISDINLGEKYTQYKDQIVDVCKIIQIQLTTDHSFSRKKLYHEISDELMSFILNNLNDYFIKPQTNRLIEDSLLKISESIQKQLNGITFEEELGQFRSKYQMSVSLNKIGNNPTDEKIAHLSKEQQEIILEKIKTKKGDCSDLGAIASKLKKPIAIYKKGVLFDIIGDKNQGEPIKLDYDPKNGGHWSPHDVKNFQNNELNNCMYEAIAYQAGKQNVNTDPFDLKIYAALDKVENAEKYIDIKQYHTHLASYNNPELLLQGGGILNQIKKIQKSTGSEQKKNILNHKINKLEKQGVLPKKTLESIKKNISNCSSQQELNNAIAFFYLFEKCGNINPEYFNEIISGAYVKMNDGGEMYKKFKKMSFKERNFGEQSSKVKFLLGKVKELESILKSNIQQQYLNYEQNIITSMTKSQRIQFEIQLKNYKNQLENNKSTISLQAGDIFKEMKVDLIDGDTWFKLESDPYPHDQINISGPKVSAQTERVKCSISLTEATVEFQAIQLKTGDKLIYQSKIDNNKQITNSIQYDGQSKNQKHQYNVQINQNGLNVSYTFQGPYGMQIGGEYRDGKIFINAGIGCKFGNITIEVIKVEVSGSNIKNSVKRSFHRINPMKIGQTTGQYGYSKFTQKNPIKISIKELKNNGQMSSDEEI